MLEKIYATCACVNFVYYLIYLIHNADKLNNKSAYMLSMLRDNYDLDVILFVMVTSVPVKLTREEIAEK